jgi:hypothetical protein
VLERAVVRSTRGGRARVRYGERAATVEMRAGAAMTLDGMLQAH